MSTGYRRRRVLVGSPDGGALVSDGGSRFAIGTTDVVPDQADPAARFALALATSEAIAAQTITQLLRITADPDDQIVAQAEAHRFTTVLHAPAASDNDNGQTDPANAIGEPDGTVATVTTSNSLGDLTNPVRLTLSGFTADPVTEEQAAEVRAWFACTVPGGMVDTARVYLRDLSTATEQTLWTAGDGTVDYRAAPLIAPIALGLNVDRLVLRAEYTAAVTATPQTEILVDAAAFAFEVTL